MNIGHYLAPNIKIPSIRVEWNLEDPEPQSGVDAKLP